jgi:hypothetical protein
MSIRTQNETIIRVDWLTKDGKHEYEIVDEEKLSEFLTEREEAGVKAEVKFTQTFTIYEVSDEDPLKDFATIVDSPIEQANIINSRLKRKQRKFAQEMLEQDNFTPVEGSYDLADAAAAVAERKSASPEVKAARALSKLAGFEVTPEALAEILKAMNPQSANA